ncbi:MAG TPA: hypothetical protein VFI11_15350 [Anaerolineales bacterium]|nr:hypothetical protein [Anaerolineales bacterium]
MPSRVSQSALEEAYAAATEGSLLVSVPPSGILKVSGGTRLDLLQRLSTNDVAGIGEREVRPTILTTAIGRLVDRLEVVSFADHLILRTSPGRGPVVQDWLQRHVFFQDDVSVAPAFDPVREWLIAGPLAADRVRGAAGIEGSPGPGEALEVAGGLVWGAQPPEPPGIHLAFEASAAPASLRSSGESDHEEASFLAFDALRIESGLPLYGREFTEGDLPLEVGLTYAVSFTKGCYLGQEIIARMESRARIPRRLMGAFLDAPLAAPADVSTDTGLAARVTSVAFSPRRGWIGLAVVRTEMSGRPAAKDPDAPRVRLADLPFPD